MKDHVHITKHGQQRVIWEKEDGTNDYATYGGHVNTRTLNPPVDPNEPCPGWPECEYGPQKGVYEFDTSYWDYGDLVTRLIDVRSAVHCLLTMDCDSPVQFRFDDAGNLWHEVTSFEQVAKEVMADIRRDIGI